MATNQKLPAKINMLRNIEAVFQLATPQDKAEGMTWYENAYHICNDIALSNALDVHVVAGVMAALSPSNKWKRNVQDCKAVCTVAQIQGTAAVADVTVSTYGANKVKAQRILEEHECESEDVRSILNGPKVIEFFNSILSGDDVCIDGHAFNIAMGEQTTLSKVPNIGIKMRRAIKACYTTAAEKHGIRPSQMQAITWVAWRRMHGIK